MFSRFVASALVIAVVAGFMIAGEYNGTVSEHKDGKVTFTTRAKKGEKGEKKTLKVGKGVKITKGEDEVKVADFDKMIEDAGKGKGKMKGVFAKITTEGDGDDEKVTKIEIRAGGKKKKDN